MTTNSARPAFQMFRLSHIVGYIALTVLFLASAACNQKSQSAPGDERSQSGAALVESNSGWKLDLKVAPDHPRMVTPTTFTLHIADTSGKPVDNAQVTGSLNMKLMDMGKTAVKFESRGNGNYEGTVPSFDMSGSWELTVDATQDALHAHQLFPVTVSD